MAKKVDEGNSNLTREKGHQIIPPCNIITKILERRRDSIRRFQYLKEGSR